MTSPSWEVGRKVFKKRMIIGAAAAVLMGGCLAGYVLMEKNAAAGGDIEPEIVLCYGEVNPEGHIMTESAHYFADKVEELTDGKVVVEIYPSGQLGDDARCYQSMEMGALDLYRGNSMSLAEYENSMMSALVLPYLFRNREHFWGVCSSEVGREILNNVKDCTGMIGLGYLDEGARNFFTTDKPVRRLEDMRGLKIRVQATSMMSDTVQALGAEAVPIAYAELYTALESGTVDGAENPPVSYYYNKFYKFAPYYMKDGHTYTPGVILVSEITWKNLKKEYQEALTEAARQTQEYNRKAIEAADQSAYAALRQEGVTIIEPEDPEAWSEAMEPVYQKYGAEYLDLVREIQQMR